MDKKNTRIKEPEISNEDPFESISLSRQCIRLLIQTNREHRALTDNNVSRIGIHRSQHHLLMYLSDRTNFPSQKEIADNFGISSAAVAVSLKKLEKNGYIERNTSEDDNRCNEIRLTEKGKKVVSDTRFLFDEIDAAAFKDFSEDEMQELSSLLGKLKENMNTAQSEMKQSEQQEERKG